MEAVERTKRTPDEPHWLPIKWSPFYATICATDSAITIGISEAVDLSRRDGRHPLRARCGCMAPAFHNSQARQVQSASGCRRSRDLHREPGRAVARKNIVSFYKIPLEIATPHGSASSSLTLANALLAQQWERGAATWLHLCARDCNGTRRGFGGSVRLGSAILMVSFWCYN